MQLSPVSYDQCGLVEGEFAFCVNCSGYTAALDHIIAGHVVVYGKAAIRQSARMKLWRIFNEPSASTEPIGGKELGVK